MVIISSYQELLITPLCTLYWSHMSIRIECKGGPGSNFLLITTNYPKSPTPTALNLPLSVSFLWSFPFPVFSNERKARVVLSCWCLIINCFLLFKEERTRNIRSLGDPHQVPVNPASVAAILRKLFLSFFFWNKQTISQILIFHQYFSHLALSH